MNFSLADPAIRAIAAVERGLDSVRHRVGGSARPDRVQILLYAGYRSESRLYLSGRVVSGRRSVKRGQSRLSRLRTMLDLYESDEVPGVELAIELADEVHKTKTDEEGYFELQLEIDRPLPDHNNWEKVKVRAANVDADEQEHELGVLAPGTAHKLAVISDIDDTVMETGSTSLFSKGWNGLFRPPQDRMAVPGAPELYKMLAHGSAGPENPIFYLSSSPWNLYEYIARFMELKDIPHGPMFLTDYGFSKEKFFANSHVEHKIEAARTLVSFYPDFKFLLVGDSGQKDVETYHRVLSEHPESIAGVFIRDVEGGCQDEGASRLLDEMRDHGVEVHCEERLDACCEAAARLGFTRPGGADETEPAGVNG